MKIFVYKIERNSKMKKILSLVLLLSLMLGLFSCGNKNSDIPEGMQLVRGGSEVGYYMYAPEEWTVSNQADISAAYASKSDPSSITYTEVEPPNMSVGEYFAESSKSYTSDMKFRLLTGENGSSVKFGNADIAVKFEFEYELSGIGYRSMQILAEYGDRFGIFTFTSFKDSKSSSDISQYEYYGEKIDKVIQNFKYVEKTTEKSEPKYEVKDGYKLVSDKTVSKFKLYVPENFEVKDSSGSVTVLMPDGSSVNMSRATQTNLYVDSYLNKRIEEMKSIAHDVKIIEHVYSDGTKSNFNTDDSLGDARSAASQEYTYVYNGVTYHVYQICAITTFNGFVFTYTATEENYQKNLDTVKDIKQRVEF